MKIPITTPAWPV